MGGQGKKPEIGKDLGKMLASTWLVGQFATVGRDLWGLWSVAVSCTVAVLYLVWVATHSDYLDHVRRFGVVGVGVAYAASLLTVALWESAPVVAQVGLPASVWTLAAVVTVRIVAPESRLVTLRALMGLTTLAMSISITQVSVATIRAGHTLTGLGVAGGCVSLFGVGIATILGRANLGGIAVIGFGTFGVGLGIALLRDNGWGGIAVIVFGILALGIGVEWFRNSDTLLKFVPVLLPICALGVGVAALWEGHTLLGLVAVCVSLALAGLEIAELRGTGTLNGLAIIGSGVAMAGLGILFLGGEGVLVGLTVIGSSLTAIGVGLSQFVGARRSVARRAAAEIGPEQMSLFDVPESGAQS